MVVVDGVRSAEQLLAAARKRLRRVTPRQAYSALEDGALLVDIRLAEEREEQGVIPGALVISRNHLEWRLDPTSEARIPQATDHDRVVILFCVEGYTSSLAAATLQDMGFAHATDMEGGYMAWVREGLPTQAASSPSAVSQHRADTG